MNTASLADLLALRRLRERRAGIAAAQARESVLRAARARDDAEQACSAFEADRQAREQAAYAGMVGRTLAVRAVQSAAARIAEDAVQAEELTGRRDKAGVALEDKETSLREAERTCIVERRNLERLDSLIERLEAEARSRDDAREEASLEELTFPGRRT